MCRLTGGGDTSVTAKALMTFAAKGRFERVSEFAYVGEDEIILIRFFG